MHIAKVLNAVLPKIQHANRSELLSQHGKIVKYADTFY